MDSTEAQRQMDIANNNTSNDWFTRDMNALAQARDSYRAQDGGDAR